MFVDFDKIFHPSNEDKATENKFINSIIEKIIKRDGETCATCAHVRSVQQSPYYDYTTCEYDRTLEFPYGQTLFKCDKYEKMNIT